LKKLDMKRNFFAFIFLLTSIFITCAKPKKKLSFVEQMPEFPGGEKALMYFLSKHIKYPPYALENKIEGTVLVEFVVKSDGSVSNTKVLKEVKGGCSEEALRVVNKMPKWKPGMQNGKPVNVNFRIPISFALPNEEKPFKFWADKMPTFPGGEEALKKYLKENMKYPQEAIDKKIEGVVELEFTINSSGQVTFVRLIKGLEGGCTQEATRLMYSMPNWMPAEQNGTSVPSILTLPIEFKLP
jgi:TonB family protein